MPQHREIPKRASCPALDLADEDVLTHLCFAQTPVANADLILVFGNNVQHAAQARHTAALCKAHPKAAIVLTGGQPEYSDSLGAKTKALAESDALRLELSKLVDLERRRVFLERRSANTRENVVFAADYIRGAEPKALVFLSQSFALGRSFMTIRAVLPEIAHVGSLGMDRKISHQELSRTTWHNHRELRDVVWGEFLRIVNYSRRGDIDPGEQSDTIDRLAAKYLT